MKDAADIVAAVRARRTTNSDARVAGNGADGAEVRRRARSHFSGERVSEPGVREIVRRLLLHTAVVTNRLLVQKVVTGKTFRKDDQQPSSRRFPPREVVLRFPPPLSTRAPRVLCMRGGSFREREGEPPKKGLSESIELPLLASDAPTPPRSPDFLTARPRAQQQVPATPPPPARLARSLRASLSGAMDSRDGIQKLLTAEQEAQAIVTAAREGARTAIAPGSPAPGEIPRASRSLGRLSPPTPFPPPRRASPPSPLPDPLLPPPEPFLEIPQRKPRACARPRRRRTPRSRRTARRERRATRPSSPSAAGTPPRRGGRCSATRRRRSRRCARR